MILATAGWFVVHAIWIGALIGGVVALLLAALGDRRTRLRYALGYAGLMLIVLLPLVMTVATVDLFTRTVRVQATEIVESTIGLATFVDWRRWIVRGAAMLWAAGFFVVTARLVRAWQPGSVVRHTATMDPDPLLRQLAATLHEELRVTSPVTILASRAVDVPMVFGWRRSTILVPVSASRDLNVNQLRAVLAHELAHVRRRDYAANLLQVVADAVLWFHPAARWLSRRVRVEREYCCDDIAVSLTTDRADYARALARLEDARHDSPLVIAAASGTLFDRIQRVVGTPRPVLTPWRAAAALVLAMAIASTVAALAQVVPPRVPLDARLRSRTPAPVDGALARTPGPTFPRIPRR